MSEYRIGVLSDIHGEIRVLERILEACREDNVGQLVLLGDLVDRAEQVEPCLDRLAAWNVTGVLGNHDREVLDAAGIGFDVPQMRAFSDDYATGQLRMYEALFIHDELLRDRNGTEQSHHQITFAGHTHYRQARDEHGPIDISLGRIRLRADRSYLINPGAVVDGQFVIWDRSTTSVSFERV